MTVAILLFGYAGLLGLLGPMALRSGTWATRSPRLAIACWQILSASVLASVILAGITMDLDGRGYTYTVKAVDSSGNLSTAATLNVSAPALSTSGTFDVFTPTP